MRRSHGRRKIDPLPDAAQILGTEALLKAKRVL